MSTERIAKFLQPFVLGTGLIFLAAFAIESPLESRFANYPRQPIGDQQIAYPWKSEVIYITPSDNAKVAALDAATIVGGLVLVSYVAARLAARRNS